MNENLPPTVTIGIPVFNQGDFLPVALDSVLRQTYPHFEIVISDNASTDSTAAVCKEYLKKDSRIRYYQQPTTIAAHKNFEWLFRHSKSKYFCWLCADDRWTENNLETLIGFLEKHPSVLLCCGKTSVIYEEPPSCRLWELAELDKSVSNRKAREAFFRHLPFNETYFAFMGLHRRSNFEGEGDYFHARILDGKRTYLSAEVEILAKLALKGRITSVPVLTYFHLKHSEGETSSNQRKFSLRQNKYLHFNMKWRLLKLAAGAKLPPMEWLMLLGVALWNFSSYPKALILEVRTWLRIYIRNCLLTESR